MAFVLPSAVAVVAVVAVVALMLIAQPALVAPVVAWVLAASLVVAQQVLVAPVVPAFAALVLAVLVEVSPAQTQSNDLIPAARLRFDWRTVATDVCDFHPRVSWSLIEPSDWTPSPARALLPKGERRREPGWHFDWLP